MSYSYVKHNFTKGTLLTCEDLNEIEAGIEAITGDIDTLQTIVNESATILRNDMDDRFNGINTTISNTISSTLDPITNNFYALESKVNSEHGGGRFEVDVPVNDQSNLWSSVNDQWYRVKAAVDLSNVWGDYDYMADLIIPTDETDTNKIEATFAEIKKIEVSPDKDGFYIYAKVNPDLDTAKYESCKILIRGLGLA